MFQDIPEPFRKNEENRLNIIFNLQFTMEIQSKINNIDKIIGDKWKMLSDDEKRNIIEKINQEVEYQWDPRFWSQVSFQALPPILQNLIKKHVKKMKVRSKNEQAT